jgi:TipAS antibiotic-recognition domain
MSLDEDPSSARAQALVDRWNDLIRAFTGGEPGLARGVKMLYADRQNWPEDFRERLEPFTDERVWDFFRRAVAARNSRASR